jgi:tripartite-type tricarboxylate transporter receptor subunit TctC
VATADGSVFGMPNPVNTTEPLIDPERTKFDPRKFAWLGSLNAETGTCGFWAKDINTFADLKKRQLVLGTTGPASGSTIDAKALAALLKLDIKFVTGYPGLTEARLAAERGEVDGHCGLLVSSIKTDVWQQFKSGQLKVPVQMGLTKHPDLPDVPNAFDLVTSEEDKQLFRLIFGPWSYGRPLMAPPNTPADRVAALRDAVQKTLNDPAFQADAKRINLEIQPVAPEAIAKTVEEIFKTPEPVLQRARTMLGVNAR